MKNYKVRIKYQEPKECKHEEAVYLNPHNKVVQCHKCGEIFTPEEPTQEPEQVEELDENQDRFSEYSNIALAVAMENRVVLNKLIRLVKRLEKE